MDLMTNTDASETGRVARNAVFAPFLVLFAVPVAAIVAVLAGASSRVSLAVVSTVLGCAGFAVVAFFFSEWRAIRPDAATTAFSKLTKRQQDLARLLCFALLLHFMLCGWFLNYLWMWISFVEGLEPGFKG
jgi:hypothetical protein